MGVPDVKFNKPGIIQSRQKFEVKKDGTATVTTRSSDGGTQTAATGNGVKSDAARRMYGAQTSTMFRSSTPALRTFNPNKVVIDHSGTRASLNSDQGWTLASMNNLRRENAALWKQMQGHQCSGGGNKFGNIAMTGMGVLGMLNKLNAASSASTEKATGTKKAEGNNTKVGNGSNGATSVNTSFKSKLSSAGSFKDIKGLEKEAENKKANLNTDYQKNDISQSITEGLAQADVSAGMKLANANLDVSKLKLSELKPDDLEGSIKSVQDDITKVGQFKTTDLKEAQATVKAKSDDMGLQIRGLDSQITKLESQLASAEPEAKAAIQTQIDDAKAKKTELENQKKQVDKATEQLAKVETQCDTAVENLKTQMGQIKDIKEFEDNVKDKKYDLAKSQDNALKDTMKEIEDLNKQISNLKDKNADKYNKADERRASKLDALIAQRSGLYTQLGDIRESLSSAGSVEFQNSKNKTYKLQNLDKAMSFGQDPDGGKTAAPAAPAASGGGAGVNNIVSKATQALVDSGAIPMDDKGQIDMNALTNINNAVKMLKDGQMPQGMDLNGQKVTYQNNSFMIDNKPIDEGALRTMLAKSSNA